jgi:hypothetical protein
MRRQRNGKVKSGQLQQQQTFQKRKMFVHKLQKESFVREYCGTLLHAFQQ